VQIVCAVFKLHNFCIERNVPVIDIDEDPAVDGGDNNEPDNGPDRNMDGDGRRHRDNLIAARFA
jgi:hypothetical protein